MACGLPGSQAALVCFFRVFLVAFLMAGWRMAGARRLPLGRPGERVGYVNAFTQLRALPDTAEPGTSTHRHRRMASSRRPSPRPLLGPLRATAPLPRHWPIGPAEGCPCVGAYQPPTGRSVQVTSQIRISRGGGHQRPRWVTDDEPKPLHERGWCQPPHLPVGELQACPSQAAQFVRWLFPRSQEHIGDSSGTG
jgi:hypothetical protein